MFKVWVGVYVGRGQRNEVMKYEEGPEESFVHGPERPRYATAFKYNELAFCIKML